MKKFTLVLLLCISCFHLFGKKTNNENKKETKKLLTLAADFYYDAPDKTYEYAQKALEIALSQNNEKFTAQAYFLLARSSFALRIYDSSLYYTELAEAIFLELKDEFQLANIYSLYANIFYRKAEFEFFYRYSDKAIETAKKTKNNIALIEQFYTRAIKCRENSDIGTSINYINRILLLNVQSKESEQILHRCYNLIGIIYKDHALFEKSLEQMKLAVQHAEKQNLHRDLIIYYANISDIFNELNQPDSAFIFCNKSYEAFLKDNIESIKSAVYLCFAKYYLSINQFDSAKYYINEANYLKEKFSQNEYQTFYEASRIYYKSGDYETALYYAKGANAKAEEINNQTFISLSNKMIGDIYYQTGLHDFAAYYFNKFISSNSYENNIKAKQEILKLNERIIKNANNNRQKAEQNKRRISLIFLYLFGLFIIILIILIRRLLSDQKKIKSINFELQDNKVELEELLEYKAKLLDDKEQQYYNLCNNMVNGAVFRMAFDENNIQSGRFVFASSGWLKLTNSQEENILFFDRNIYPADRYKLLKSIVSAIKNNSTLDVTFRFIKGDELLWFHVRAAAVKSIDNTVFIDGYMVDETEQKLFEEKLVAAKEKAEESDRLKTAFLNNISHEIRTPMNAIIGFSNQINNKSLSDEEKEKYIKTINENCQFLLNIIDNIVELSKIETNQVKLIFKNITLKEIKDELKLLTLPPYKKKYPNLQFKLDSSFDKLSNIKFTTDKKYLLKIFEHLIDNSAKFTPEGYVEIGASIDVFNLNFYIKDTGIGIDPVYFDNIFEIFIKLNPEMSKGTGLGLPITKSLLQKLGGNIWLDSNTDSGSIFNFSVPLN